jgi:signal recognition particle GTPase
MEDIKGLFDKYKDIWKPEDEKEIEKMFKKGKFRLKDKKDQFNCLMRVRDLDKIIRMIARMSNIMPEGGEKEASKKIKK